MSSLFVTLAGALDAPTAGGVQICSQEFRRVLIAAGFDCRVWPVTLQYSVPARARLRVLPHFRTFSDFGHQDALLADEVERAGVRDVFLNMVDVAPLARAIRERSGDRCAITLLSHGLGSADFLQEMRMARSAGRPALGVAGDALRLGLQLLEEVEQRRSIDHVLCLSETERELELWLGARRATWLPRMGHSNRLDWRPVPGRIGFVGTLDHPPNADGLDRYLRAMQTLGGGEVRVVGGPASRGDAIERTFPFAKYLGPLDDRALEAEAATWTCMVHPVFCYARGCSTKLAVGLGWGIPVATTEAGRRGYRWREGDLPLADSPLALARLTQSLREPEQRDRLRREVERVAASMPSLSDNATLVREALASRAPRPLHWTG